MREINQKMLDCVSIILRSKYIEIKSGNDRFKYKTIGEKYLKQLLVDEIVKDNSSIISFINCFGINNNEEETFNIIFEDVINGLIDNEFVKPYGSAIDDDGRRLSIDNKIAE